MLPKIYFEIGSRFLSPSISTFFCYSHSSVCSQIMNIWTSINMCITVLYMMTQVLNSIYKYLQLFIADPISLANTLTPVL